jgi:hypothetical protein
MRRVRHESHFVRAGLAILTIRTRHAALIISQIRRKSLKRGLDIFGITRGSGWRYRLPSREMCVWPL